jgi:hypothetical protein
MSTARAAGLINLGGRLLFERGGCFGRRRVPSHLGTRRRFHAGGGKIPGGFAFKTARPASRISWQKMKVSAGPTPTDPTPEEIAEATAAIRSTWSERVRRSRAGIFIQPWLAPELPESLFFDGDSPPKSP